MKEEEENKTILVSDESDEEEEVQKIKSRDEETNNMRLKATRIG